MYTFVLGYKHDIFPPEGYKGIYPPYIYPPFRVYFIYMQQQDTMFPCEVANSANHCDKFMDIRAITIMLNECAQFKTPWQQVQ